MASDGQPALICAACRASMPLDRAVTLDAVRRSLTCPQCGAVTTWSLDDADVVDLRESDPDDPNDDVEAAGPNGRRER